MKNRNLSIIFQLCFWFLIISLQLVMATNFLPFTVAVAFAGINMVMGMLFFYGNSRWIFPRFFERGRYGWYLLINILLIGLMSHLFFLVDGYLVVNYMTEPLPPHLPKGFPYFRITSFLMFVFFISLVFSLIRKTRAQELSREQLSREKSDTEIRLLKAQINPHFIFNSLNNIYSLSYTKSDDTPEAVLKLSDMLRYVYYDCNRDEVSLGAEVEYIRNYMAFQQMKSPHEQDIELVNEGIDESYRIAPMLFIPFVENAFKYSKIEDQQGAWVKIELKTDKKELSFHIRNTHPAYGKIAGSGMGIQNVQNRLELTYPGQHHLEIKDENGVYEVHMKIKAS